MKDLDISLKKLEQQGRFISRHIGIDAQQAQTMCATVGVADIEELTEQVVPQDIRESEALNLPEPLSEDEALQRLHALAQENVLLHSMIGQGYHDCITPAVIRRNMLENPGWYTSYTPYQAEISQGRLEMLLNFQQMVVDLTGLPVANASLLDEATAAAEAMALCQRWNRTDKSEVFYVADQVLPQTLDVLRGRASGLGIDIVVGPAKVEALPPECFGALLQYPGADGVIGDMAPLVQALHKRGAKAVVSADLLALVLLPSPGVLGADVAVGSAQRFGVPMGYGGPYAAFIAVADEAVRMLPGRLIGVARDANGETAYRMALQTREQHIRRERATSNICTAQALLANMAAAYAIYHGPLGLRYIALRVHRMTRLLAAGLREAGAGMYNENTPFFDTLRVASDQPEQVVARAQQHGVNLLPLDGAVGVSVNECTTREHLLAVLQSFVPEHTFDLDDLEQGLQGVELGALRTDAVLEHSVFNSYHTETEMMRYLYRLERKDIALNQSMIGLGSCTMKLNAAAEMEPVSAPGFANLHPFVPAEQAQGYTQLFADLEQWLAEVTGFAAISLQPNAGSQGEYAGLRCIRAWQQARGEGHRDLCLIPASAHGTNPASAVLAGLKVLVLRCDTNGNIDMQHLQSVLQEQGSNVAAMMLTYPSTHGVFESTVVQICEQVHEAGGQVYLDGANMNALMGLARPGRFGADVAHLNLHKTFCIPHGGGGPGVGAIGVGEHLKPYLPSHPALGGESHAISAAPWGSAGILPISWAYIAMSGGEGLMRCSQVAILSANYLAEKLQAYFPVLYRGESNRVAHECILDLRPLKQQSGVTEEDIAKRLMDFGFHAPTMSFPVPGTLMIEPTESESLAELDRFVEAMVSIHAEIDAVVAGMPLEQSPLRLAPHSLTECLAQEWDRPYRREQGCFPGSWQNRANKYWPPVGRVDNVGGDRNLCCTLLDLNEQRLAD